MQFDFGGVVAGVTRTCMGGTVPRIQLYYFNVEIFLSNREIKISY